MSSNDRLTVLAVVPSVRDTSPGQRFRIEQWEPFLAAAGIDVDIQPFGDEQFDALLHRPGLAPRKAASIGRGVLRRGRLLTTRNRYDAVYLFREAAVLGPHLFEWCLARPGLPLFFDFDDAVYLRYKSPTNGWLSLLKFPGKTRAVCRIATQVIAGNAVLAEYARQFNDHVTIIPTTIDVARHVVAARVPALPPVIGWTGSHSTVQYLDTLRRPLQRLAADEHFKLRVIGTDDYRIDGVPVDATKWTFARELQDLSEIDIGVMPLPDDQWTRGKCGLKALQYMALGLPAVCSPVGVNCEIVQHGVNGLLAATDDEWVAALGELLHSSPMRERLGRAGRRTVEDRYSAQVHAPRFADLIRSAVESERSHGQTRRASAVDPVSSPPRDERLD